MRLLAVSFAADLQVYLIYTAAPFKALQLGAGPLTLGILAAASTGTYALVVLASGRASDRVPRLLLARVCCLGVILACIGLTLAHSLTRLVLMMPLMGASMAFFWPCIQASIADRSDFTRLEQNLGRFNLAWSMGKGCGFLAGGMLLTALGVPATLTVSSAIVFAIFFVLPWPNATLGPIDALLQRNTNDVSAAVEAAPIAVPTVNDVPPIDPRATIFRRMAWLANCTAYGITATLIYHYPAHVTARGWSPRVFGVLLGAVYLIQTIGFTFLMRRPDVWRFRRLRLYVPQILMMAAIAALPLADLARLGLTALVFGMGLGVCYYSSIYYSLLTHDNRGRNAGVHEALIGLGGMVVPLLGGCLARWMGAASAPYWTAAAAVAVSLLAQEALYRASRRTALA